MPQQINLLTPILLAPRRHFSAAALAQTVGLLLLAGLALAAWLHHRDRTAQAQTAALLAQYATERQALQVAQAGLPAPLDTAALAQQLSGVEAGNAQRAAALQSLAGPGRSPAELLALLATTLPEGAWLSELTVGPGRLTLSGATLDTTVLRPWLTRLAAHPLLAGQDLAALRVERVGTPATGGSPPLLPAADQAAAEASGRPVWAFRVVSAVPPAASAPASGVAR